ncbi:hypothetical protein [Halopiger goleimassiliensis]|uniref:hypothetical protein n=1 Tax=Halopiger goleimassiliensis TaxID=1293048 RepID=UPI0006782E04|nr:hypothetical protein [Halopiger goleimassiliensis]
MNDRRRPRGRFGRWHALLERYTPDGPLGRVLLGSITGTVGLWLLAALLFEIPRWGLTLSALLWAPTLLAVGVPLVAFAALVLWPLYLSLIGNIESTEAYAGPGSSRASTGASDSSAVSGSSAGGVRTPESTAGERTSDRADDPFADLKAMYERGELSEDELERRIEARMAESDDSAPDATRAGVADTDPGRERTIERR